MNVTLISMPKISRMEWQTSGLDRRQESGRERRGEAKQETLEPRSIVIHDTNQLTVASKPAVFSNPVLPVLQELGSLCATMRGGR